MLSPLLVPAGRARVRFCAASILLELPSKGSISVAGEAIKFKPGVTVNPATADPKQVQRLRTKLGMVFQNFNSWST